MSSLANKSASWKSLLLPVALFTAVILAYYPAWHAGFIWDDDIYVIKNPLLSAPDGLRRIWLTFDSPSQYFPLVYTTLRLEYSLWGLAPFGYHMVNIVLHGANALLLWRLLARLKVPGGLLAAAIFALHPVQVESVAWVTELKNVEMGFFFMLTLLAWTRYAGHPSGRGWFYYSLSLVLYSLSLFSKTTACTIPAALLAITWIRGERMTMRRIIEVVPFALLGIGMGVITIYWERFHQGTQGRIFQMGWIDRLLVASRGVWFYLYKLAWPAKLTFSYPKWTLSAADPVVCLWPLSICGVIILLYLVRKRIGSAPLVAIGYFIAMLCPVLGFIMLYTFRYTFVADHYQYLACIGPIVLLSAGLERLASRGPTLNAPYAPVLSGVILVPLAMLTWNQCSIYKDVDTLWRATIANNPSSWLARLNLGRKLYLSGRLEEAKAFYNEALNITHEQEDIYNDLGDTLLKQGHTKEAVAEYYAALKVNPKCADSYYNLGVVAGQQGRVNDAIALYREALQYNPFLVEAHDNLGNLLLAAGQRNAALAEYGEALRINPNFAGAYINYGNMMISEDQIVEATAAFRKALQCDPGSAAAHYALGNIASRAGQIQEAAAEYQAAERAQPDFAQAYNNLGVILDHNGQLSDAVAQYRQALAADPDYAEAWSNLGNVLYALGEASDAISSLEKALALQPANATIMNNLALMLATAPNLPAKSAGARALQLATQASDATGHKNANILRTLSIAYAANGQFSDALRTAQAALEIAKAQSNPTLAGELDREAKLYAAGQPFHK